MYTVRYVDKHKFTFKLVINWTNEILYHTVVSSGLSRPGIIDARARQLRNPDLDDMFRSSGDHHQIYNEWMLSSQRISAPPPAQKRSHQIFT
jgi:hypothetical protein